MILQQYTVNTDIHCKFSFILSFVQNSFYIFLHESILTYLIFAYFIF